jgi:hypothetical protein
MAARGRVDTDISGQTLNAIAAGITASIYPDRPARSSQRVASRNQTRRWVAVDRRFACPREQMVCGRPKAVVHSHPPAVRNLRSILNPLAIGAIKGCPATNEARQRSPCRNVQQEKETLMGRQCLYLSMAALALAIFVSHPALAEEKSHEGLVVKTAEGKLTMTMKDGTKEHSHDVTKDTKVMLDDKPAKLADLKKGFHIKVWMDGDKVTKIEGHSKVKT